MSVTSATGMLGVFDLKMIRYEKAMTSVVSGVEWLCANPTHQTHPPAD
ncbi:hypothetical protein ACFODZ_01050 [Marinicella sediminis]|uniref:Uncharacterized protein n=1 Tax=Marinicella sediminis TaxID=1792834 RepID=A0ABV7J3T0_9GAMM|nr:hypothetical protein [Marinicella sediminis]